MRTIYRFVCVKHLTCMNSYCICNVLDMQQMDVNVSYSILNSNHRQDTDSLTGPCRTV